MFLKYCMVIGDGARYMVSYRVEYRDINGVFYRTVSVSQSAIYVVPGES